MRCPGCDSELVPPQHRCPRCGRENGKAGVRLTPTWCGRYIESHQADVIARARRIKWQLQRDGDDTMDLVQDGLVAFLEKVERSEEVHLEGETHLENYLAKFIEHRAKDAAKRDRAVKHGGNHRRVPLVEEVVPPAEQPGPATVLDSEASNRRFFHVFRNLLPEERQIFLLGESLRGDNPDQLTWGEIAGRLGLGSPDAARMQFERLCKRICKELGAS